MRAARTAPVVKPVYALYEFALTTMLWFIVVGAVRWLMNLTPWPLTRAPRGLRACAFAASRGTFLWVDDSAARAVARKFGIRWETSRSTGSDCGI